jgi:hypothetical protein
MEQWKMKKKICILVFANIAHDIRVQRQVEAARPYYDVDVVAQGNWTPPEGVNYLPLPKTIFKASPMAAVLLAAGNLNRAYWNSYYWRRKEYVQALDLIKGRHYDLIHANDLDALPVAVEAGKINKALVLFDAHEFYMEQGETRLDIEIRKPFRTNIFNVYGSQAVRMITVSQGISELYASRFGVNSDVIMNAPYYVQHDFQPVDPLRINLINHGSAIRGRRIEDMIKMMTGLDERFHLNLLLKPSHRDYYERIKLKAGQIAPGRVTIMDPVPPNVITHEISKFDIGIHMLDAKILNHYYALPKKIFEYVMAGLCVAVTPLIEMKRMVENGRLGVVADGHSWQDMAKSLNTLTAEKVNLHKKNSLELAKTLNANTDMKKLMEIYEQILS